MGHEIKVILIKMTRRTKSFFANPVPHVHNCLALVGLIILVAMAPLALSAQIQATDQQGRKILIYPDGTWVLVDSTATPGSPADKKPKAPGRTPAPKAEAAPKDKKGPRNGKADLDVFGEALTLDTVGSAQREREMVNAMSLPPAPDTLAATGNAVPIGQAPVLLTPPLPTLDRWKVPVRTEVLPHPTSAQPCQFTRNQLDEFTGRQLRALAESYFFGFRKAEEAEGGARAPSTEDYLSVYAGFSQDGENYFLHLTFVLHSPYGRAEYGYIPEGASLQLMLIDGEVVPLNALKADRGRVVGEETHYRAQFFVDPKLRKILQGGEVDKVRMAWSSGHETYEVYDVDFIARLLRCFFVK